MAIRVETLPVSIAGLRALRWSADAPHTGLKETYVIGQVEHGRAEWWGRGRIWHSAPGSMHLKHPGDVHRDLACDGPMVVQVVALPITTVEDAVGRVDAPPQLQLSDPRAAPFVRLHRAVRQRSEALELETAIIEAIAALGDVRDDGRQLTRPVRHALALLSERLEATVSLDAIAQHAGIDKFHLCRAFRAQVGMAPHAYRTRLRIQRAKELLALGTAPGDVAARVGLYDQSQLNRHFRRIVGTTPGQYARSL